MRLLHPKHLIVLAIAIFSSLLLGERARADWFRCDAAELVIFAGSRTHVRCNNAMVVNGISISYLAVPSDSENQRKFYLAGSSALESSAKLYADIPSSPATNAPGCDASNCRTPTNFGLWDVCNGADWNACGACGAVPVEVCDGRDNDCDGTIDDGFRNACGGACMAALAHPPGQACNNGLRGACARTGVYTCQGTDATVCSAGTGTPTNEICDGVDNDCNGATDEGGVCSPPCGESWQQCCGGGVCHTTNAQPLRCTSSAAGGAFCVPCGNNGEACCFGNYGCQDDLQCNPYAGTCEPITYY